MRSEQTVGDLATVGDRQRDIVRIRDRVAVEPVDFAAERFLRRDAVGVAPGRAGDAHAGHRARSEGMEGRIVAGGAVETERAELTVLDPPDLSAQQTRHPDEPDPPRGTAVRIGHAQRQEPNGGGPRASDVNVGVRRGPPAASVAHRNEREDDQRRERRRDHPARPRGGSHPSGLTVAPGCAASSREASSWGLRGSSS